ncbi:MAG: hypothetical protein IKJ99_02550 [Oscillospiraceae bacterium]|nr:hypothetical protein [Oscillospiraceae bacterium]
MIDIHCHILPAFDDGSTSMAESLAMAKMAASSGVSGIVTTPHFPGEPASLWRLKPLLERFQHLESALQKEAIPLKLYLGAEVLCLPQTPAMAERHALPTIGNSDYILVEFDFGESGRYMTQMLDALRVNGYKPVVAHPERYDAVQQNPVLCQYWLERIGCIMQINKGSLLGTFGNRVQKASHFLIDHGLAHLVASDAHSADRRTTHMGPARQWLEQHCGPDYAWVLLERNPARLIENRPMVPINYQSNTFN